MHPDLRTTTVLDGQAGVPGRESFKGLLNARKSVFRRNAVLVQTIDELVLGEAVREALQG